MNKALFAGGCFWCTEAAFAEINGVIKTISGYTGGSIINPTYEMISDGSTGHYESLYIEYDENIINYDSLLDIFWQNIDPFDHEGQFYDKGTQYHTAIFYYNDEQKQLAEISKKKYQERFLNKIIVTNILKADAFYPAENYHQSYYKNNAFSYERYKNASNRVNKLKEIWQKFLSNIDK